MDAAAVRLDEGLGNYRYLNCFLYRGNPFPDRSFPAKHISSAEGVVPK
jgi:hypothetical protein